MTVSSSLRFKIFERDKFTCQYCGRRPPDVVLHCDHIHPKSKGGTNNELNLITSCKGCNLGKGKRVLGSIKYPNLKEEIKNLKETKKQIEEYYKYLKAVTSYKEESPILDLVCEKWCEYICPNIKGVSVNNELRKKFKSILKNNDAEDLISAIEILSENENVMEKTSGEKIKYLFGILKNLSLKRTNPELAQKNEDDYRSYYRLLKYWENKPRGSGYLPKYQCLKWLQIYSENEIMYCMDEANGIWEDLKNQLD